MNYLALAEENKDLLIEMRRYLHTHPETSGNEVETVRFICSKLDELGISYEVVEEGGIIGCIDSRKPGKTLLLRADCDALPMDESETNELCKKSCVSPVKGAAHTCGHDLNTASLLVVCKILMEQMGNWCGKAVLYFERSEEKGGIFQYNLLKYLEDHKIKIDGGLACHVNVGPAGTATLIKGPSHAGSMSFDYTIQGKGGHGARPYQANNPINCFQAIGARFDQYRMNKLGPYDPCTMTICSVHSGDAANVIPDTLRFSGNVRYFDLDRVGVKVKAELSEMVKQVAAAYDCQVIEEKLGKLGIPNVNNVDCADFAEKVLTDAFGSSHVIIGEPSMGSETFSLVSALYPSVLIFFGVVNEDKGITFGIHHPKFDIDEDKAHYMPAFALAYAVEFMGSGLEPDGSGLCSGVEQLYKQNQ